MSSVWMTLGLLASAYAGWQVSRKKYGFATYAALLAISAFIQAAQ